MEGLTGIEPASLVWKTKALPLSYSPEIDGFPPLRQFYGIAQRCLCRPGRRLDFWGPISTYPRAHPPGA